MSSFIVCPEIGPPAVNLIVYYFYTLISRHGIVYYPGSVFSIDKEIVWTLCGRSASSIDERQQFPSSTSIH